jgi:hypothetical protein
MEMKDAKTLSVKEVARRKRCTVKYVYDLLAADRLQGARKHGKKWSIPVESIGVGGVGTASMLSDMECEPSMDPNRVGVPGADGRPLEGF